MICVGNQEYVSGKFQLQHPIDSKCYNIQFKEGSGNPIVAFEGIEPHTKISIDNDEASTNGVDTEYFEGRLPAVQEILIGRDLSDPQCNSIGEPGNPVDTIIASYRGALYVHDPRFVSVIEPELQPRPCMKY